jgi:hypothetical protein
LQGLAFQVAPSRFPGASLSVRKPAEQPLNAPSSVAELAKFVSNQIPVNLTQGTSTDCSEAYVGDFSNVLTGVRPTIRIRVKVLSERYANNLQVGLIAWIRGDVGLAHPEHLSVAPQAREVSFGGSFRGRRPVPATAPRLRA